MSITELKDKFIASMKWSDEATEHEKTLVICNVSTFANQVEAKLKAEANKMVCVYCGFKADKNAKVMVDHITEHCKKRPDSMVNMKKVHEDFKQLENQLLIYAEALRKIDDNRPKNYKPDDDYQASLNMGDAYDEGSNFASKYLADIAQQALDSPLSKQLIKRREVELKVIELVRKLCSAKTEIEQLEKITSLDDALEALDSGGRKE